MGAEIKNQLAALDSFMAVQRNHLSALADGMEGDLNDWCRARQAVFGKLQESLAMLSLDEIAGVEQEKVLTKMREIVVLQSELDVAARRRKLKLAHAIAAMRKGRKALHSYAGKGDSAPQPRFLSSRM